MLSDPRPSTVSSLQRRQRPVGILGATGVVGQRLVHMLDQHPFFKVHVLGASHRSKGHRYMDVVKWRLAMAMPPSIQDHRVLECDLEKEPGWKECEVVFSALDASVAHSIESSFSSAGIPVFSNSKCFRMDPKVPLMTPTANPDHLTLIKGRKGFIVTNPNCSTTGLVVILKALTNAFGPIHQVHVVTLQAMSGAGYPGIPSLDLFDNCVPYIEGEEEKMAMETQKILGTCQGTSIEHASSMKVSATCTRVPVIDGHTLVVSVSFERRPVPSIQDVMHALKTYAPEGLVTACPTYTHSIHVFEQGVMDRPQPRLDRDLHQGMAVSIGRIRTCPILDIQFVALLHNTILGAAGSTLMNAELAELNGYFSSNSP